MPLNSHNLCPKPSGETAWHLPHHLLQPTYTRTSMPARATGRQINKWTDGPRLFHSGTGVAGADAAGMIHGGYSLCTFVCESQLRTTAHRSLRRWHCFLFSSTHTPTSLHTGSPGPSLQGQALWEKLTLMAPIPTGRTFLSPSPPVMELLRLSLRNPHPAGEKSPACRPDMTGNLHLILKFTYALPSTPTFKTA